MIFMYFVDRDKIEETLLFMEKNIAIWKNQEKLETDIERLALERIIQVVIEGMLDVGNAMIDGFIMRDPGSYEDIIDILEDEKVILEQEALSLKEIIQFRKELVQNYINVNHNKLTEIITKNEIALQSFPENIRKYLTEELGPVSAFKK